MRRRTFLVSSTAVLPLLVGCTGREAPSENGGGGDGTTAPESATVEITGDAFEPKEVSVAVGGTVTWENTTDTDQRITSHRYETDAAEWDFPESPLGANSSVEHTFEEEGLYQYYSITGGGQYSMCGAITVGDAPESDSLC